MPVEIRQLQIRINVNEQDRNNSTNNISSKEDGRESRRNREDALVAECLEQMLRILEEQNER